VCSFEYAVRKEKIICIGKLDLLFVERLIAKYSHLIGEIKMENWENIR
jgi:hypothetical protein